ncbi:Zn(II)2Cys6 transcription factor [Aspergillus saccharolyticus JOP 1030-1]|uniref:C6 finger domain protein n=1 Tax=Aspergillus saccharolyticus JOP 1030-1 TaxID=1450539 RepID=A0A318ZDX1_9EURO|nr:C6 finger domain protein [Aspergillus saccharolyticus JOP 1030-1]PYH45711.1 C6 finger domain protein [Aspergillus saccharolyticus JOP 1030-1]
MVFCGKPSKGCGECRSRKIRCDQARPTCSQCAKGHRVCPGYRDELSLMFRDESQQVVRKARTGATARRSKPTTKSGSSGRPGSSGSTTTSSPSAASGSSNIEVEFNDDSRADLQRQTVVRHSLDLQPSYQPTGNEAICFFLQQVNWIGSIWMRSDFVGEYIVDKRTSPSQQAMVASMTSTGMAMLARARRSAPLKTVSEKEYGQALQLLKSAVTDEKEARDNSTLAAVLLLAFFEVVSSRAPQNLDNWTNHISGAAALLELRGVEQLQRAEGLKLFLQLRFQIIISCLQREARVPQSVLDCARVAQFLRPETEAYSDGLISITGRLANLRADIREKVITDPQEILSTMYSIEGELVAWLAGLPSRFLYTIIESPRPAQSNWSLRAYNNRFHVYQDLWLCHAWNQYRCARIMISESILTYTLRLNASATLPPELASHLAQIRDKAKQWALDICASVPYHFSADLVTGEATTFRTVSMEFGFIRGMLLLWPLFLAGATERKGHSLRRWVVDCLGLIGNSMGIDQALALIDILEHDQTFDVLGQTDDERILERITTLS